MVELIRIKKNDCILDIGIGRGASLFPASEKAGPYGSVIGVDIAEGMVKETNKDIIKYGLSNAKMIQMDAETLDFKDNLFDIVLYGLSLFIFPNYENVLKETYRVLKPNEKIGFSTFCIKFSSGSSLIW